MVGPEDPVVQITPTYMLCFHSGKDQDLARFSTKYNAFTLMRMLFILWPCSGPDHSSIAWIGPLSADAGGAIHSCCTGHTRRKIVLCPFPDRGQRNPTGPVSLTAEHGLDATAGRKRQGTGP